jgi:RHS repeat-associated protein
VTVLTSQTYQYDPAGRLAQVVSGAQTAVYAYEPATGLPSGTTFTGGTQMGRSYDTLGRLRTATVAPAAGPPQSYTYQYNSLHQREKVTREDGSYWSYIYNDRGELSTGKKYWADNTPVWGQQSEYDYDSAGNRKAARTGGNPLGGLRQSAYTANSLNQYAQRGVPGALDVTGTAHSGATVTVNGQGTARRGDYFYKELAVDNGVAPAYGQVKVVGARQNFGAGGEDAVTEKGGRVFVPSAAESYSYDADGNLVLDGRWQYEWDAENRLVGMQALAGVPAEAKLRLEFAYDYAGRRIQKKVYAWNAGTSSYLLQSTARFVYDGWNLVAELDGGGTLARSHVWGPDVSGSLQGAGGVGGLLLSREGANTYAVGYDGGGNVTSLVDVGTNAAAASYDYDAFGVTIRSTGGAAQANPFRYSTKYTDAETELVYYGRRYYNPQTGRWLSRDPAAEEGGVNLYGFVSNRPTGEVDVLGEKSLSEHAYDKMMELFNHHDDEVGSEFPGDKAGRKETNCITYVRNVLEYAYQKNGRKDIADAIHAMPKDGMQLARYLVTQGWRAHYWNPDVRAPRYMNGRPDAEHSFTYQEAVRTRKYYEVPVSGFIVNYNLVDKSMKKERIWVPTGPSIPGLNLPIPLPITIEYGGDKLETFNRFKGVRFAYGLARGATHTFLYSYGDIYEVHWSKEKDDLYERSPFYDYEWLSGLMLTPPDSDFVSEDIKAPRR